MNAIDREPLQSNDIHRPPADDVSGVEGSPYHLRDRQIKAWRQALIPLVVVLLAILLVYWGTAAEMVQIWWRSETFTHAFIVPPISIWLAWRQRERLLELSPRPAPWALIPMALAGFAWLLGELVAVNALSQFALVTMMVAAVPAVLGTAVARALTFPLAFLFFSVPVGEFMLPMLMQATADFTIAALRLSGVPVYREGLRFVIPSGSWSVVEACSGVRYLIASFMVGSLFAHLNYRSAKRRWIFVGLSLLVPILANWLRAYMIVMLGHLSNNVIATGVDHLVYGWVFFGVVILALFMIGSRWTELDGTELDASAQPNVVPTTPGALGRSWSMGLLAALVMAAPVGGLRVLEAPAAPLATRSLGNPDLSANGWRQTATASSWLPTYQQPTATLSQTFGNAAGQTVGLHVFYYRQQGNGHKLISSTNMLVRGEDPYWNPVDRALRSIAHPAGAAGRLAIEDTTILGASLSSHAERERLHVWRLYWINGSWTASEPHAKLLAAADRLRGRGDAGAALLFYASERQAGDADKVLTAFVQSNLGLIEAQLVALRDARP